MARITDTKQRPWDIGINVLSLGRVREGMKSNLLELVMPDSALLDRLSTDPVDLAWCLFLVCQDQAEEQKVEQRDFYASLDRDCLEDGLRAILEGVVSFSPGGLRPAYRKVLEKARTMERMQATRIQQLVDSPDFDAMLDSQIAKALSLPDGLPTETLTNAGNLPESVESTLPTIEQPVATP